MKIFEWMHFTFYVRLSLEAFTFSLLLAAHEVILSFPNVFEHLLSTLCAWVGVLWWILLALSPIIITILKNKTSLKFARFKELYKDLRPTHFWRQYHLIFLVRRAACIGVIHVMKDMDQTVKLSTFFFINLASLGYMIALKPFSSIKENMIDIFNDFIFLMQNVIIINVSKDDFRFQFLSNIMIYLIMASGMITLLIILFHSVILAIRKPKW